MLVCYIFKMCTVTRSLSQVYKVHNTRLVTADKSVYMCTVTQLLSQVYKVHNTRLVTADESVYMCTVTQLLSQVCQILCVFITT